MVWSCANCLNPIKLNTDPNTVEYTANWIGILPHITTLLGFIIAMFHQLLTGEAGQWVMDGITKTSFIRETPAIFPKHEIDE